MPRSQSTSLIMLAIDTSTDMICCALGEWAQFDGGVFFKSLGSGDKLCRGQANEELVTVIDETLEKTGKAMSQIGAVLVGRGPGSSGGVNTGISKAKDLSRALEKPLYGASALDSVAWHAWEEGVRGSVCVIGDATHDEVYPGVFELDGLGAHRSFETETIETIDECVAQLSERLDVDDLLLTGDGLIKYRDRFEEAGFTGFVDEELWYPNGEGFLLAAASPEGAVHLGTGDPELIVPIDTCRSE